MLILDVWRQTFPHPLVKVLFSSFRLLDPWPLGTPWVIWFPLPGSLATGSPLGSLVPSPWIFGHLPPWLDPWPPGPPWVLCSSLPGSLATWSSLGSLVRPPWFLDHLVPVGFFGPPSLDPWPPPFLVVFH